jgi:hypothetical protein
MPAIDAFFKMYWMAGLSTMGSISLGIDLDAGQYSGSKSRRRYDSFFNSHAAISPIKIK